MIAWRVPIIIEGTQINDGNIIVGDINGVCVVPQIIEQEVFVGALKKS